MNERFSASQYLYYALIGIVSFIALFFLPFIGSDVGGGFTIPTDAAGWTVFVITKLIGAVVNILIYHFFIRQAKINVRENERYKQACEILERNAKKEYKPRSPGAFFGVQYGFKGVTLIITTIASTFALTQAILTFDWITMLTYVFVITLGLIFGIAEMKKVEAYWTEEYYLYALSRKDNEHDQNTTGD